MLTERQKKILSVVVKEYTQTAVPVGSKVLAGKYRFDLSSATIRNEMNELEEKGYLKKKSHIARGVSPLSQTTTVPLLGLIAAGDPIEPIENPEEISVPESISIDSRYPHYALQIKGDSMMDMGILNGDIVLIKHQLTAQNGDVVVGITEKGATLKVLCREGSKIFLEPRNKDYPIIQPKHLEIRGKFVGLLRKG